MSMHPVLKWQLFEPTEDHVLSQNKLLYAMEGMVRANQDYLRAHPETPLLYNSKVIYQREPPGKEEWCDIPTILEAGWGDCEDLAGWLVAELRERFKIPSRPFLRFRKSGGEYHYHALLILPHHYQNKAVTHPVTGVPLIDPTTGKTATERCPIFAGPYSEFVFEDPSARLGMYAGRINREGAYESIIAKARDPLFMAQQARRKRAA